jgi:hypothetical protein
MPDIWLYPEAAPDTDIILYFGLRDTGASHDWLPPQRPRQTSRVYPLLPPVPTQQPVVVATSLFLDLVARYGQREGERIYYEMQAEYKGPFQPGAKYDATVRDVPPPTLRPAHKRAPSHNIPPAKRN